MTVEAGSQSLGAVVPEADERPVGARMWLLPAAERVLLYRADDGALVSS